MGEIVARNMLILLYVIINKIGYCCIQFAVYPIVSMMHDHTNITFVITYQIWISFQTHVITYLLTYLLHGAESFLRS